LLAFSANNDVPHEKIAEQERISVPTLGVFFLTGFRQRTWEAIRMFLYISSHYPQLLFDEYVK